MGLYSYSVKNAYQSTKGNLEDIDNLNTAKQKIDCARDEFENHLAQMKKEFFDNVATIPDLTLELEAERDRVWAVVEQRAKNEFYAKYNNTNKSISIAKGLVTVKIVFGVLGAIALIAVWYSASH